MRTGMISLLVIIGLVYGGGDARADYTVVLKNGRRITAQNYREEGSMIKIRGLGGEFGIAKDQVETILKAGQTERQGLNITTLDASSSQVSSPAQKPSPAASPATQKPSKAGASSTPEISDEAREYQKRLAEVTQKLATAKQEYINATQGGGTASNVSKEGMLAWAMDLASRIHDSQKVPGGGGLSDTPPTPPYAPKYTPTERELSDLRIRIDTLERERDSLIDEMKSKNIPTEIP